MPNDSPNSTGRLTRVRNALICTIASVLFAVVGARIALWCGWPPLEGMLWGFVVGSVLAHGDRRHAPRPRAGAPLDTPPAQPNVHT